MPITVSVPPGPSSLQGGSTSTWSIDPAPGYLSRKALPIKKEDAQPLTREDVQFDLLNFIFSDDKAVFTDPFSSKRDPTEKVTFGNLYISAISNSVKCSKVLKDKMVETPAFALELAKISLLTNVGRINTTMAFFPEMKTALRTYHPVPSLQKTDGNAQDAPRIKNCLKAALLAKELKGVPPATPDEVLKKRKSGIHPPTSIVNLLFVLSTHAAPLSNIHFDGTLNFLDLFIPGKRLASSERAQAFLWLVYNYLEPEGPNPFADEYALKNPGKAPALRHLSEAEARKENVDTREEIKWGQSMSAKRNAFLRELVAQQDYEKRTGKSAAPLFISVTPDKGTGRQAQKQVYDTPNNTEDAFLYYVPAQSSPTATRPEKERAARVRPSMAVPTAEVPLPSPPPTATAPRIRPRSMVEYAWAAIRTTDPMEDSDEENESVLADYSQRVSVLRRLLASDPASNRRRMENRIQ